MNSQNLKRLILVHVDFYHFHSHICQFFQVKISIKLKPFECKRKLEQTILNSEKESKPEVLEPKRSVNSKRKS